MRIHDDEREIDDALVRALVDEQFPQWAGLPLERAGDGTVSAIYRLGDGLSVRVPRRSAVDDRRGTNPAHARVAAPGRGPALCRAWARAHCAHVARRRAARALRAGGRPGAADPRPGCSRRGRPGTGRRPRPTARRTRRCGPRRAHAGRRAPRARSVGGGALRAGVGRAARVAALRPRRTQRPRAPRTAERRARLGRRRARRPSGRRDGGVEARRGGGARTLPAAARRGRRNMAPCQGLGRLAGADRSRLLHARELPAPCARTRRWLAALRSG